MAVIDPAAVVAESMRILVRQATSSTLTSSLSASSTTAPASATTTLGGTASGTSPSASATDTSGGGGGGNNGGSSSPLLFFVALGFGVVFTNLWIIVGVKYCFRYNARNRQPRLTEDGEPITMENMQRPHRRRREKKLMTMDEVNERFPMLKYKTWAASRATQGLPTAGGVSRPESRAASIHDAEAAGMDLASKERSSTDDARRQKELGQLPVSASRAPGAHEVEEAGEASSPAVETKSTSVMVEKVPSPATPTANDESARDASGASETHPLASPQLETQTSHDGQDDGEHDDDHDDHDPINAALPPECLGTSGDTCAICIDTLEDDDDVRGLTCGHAFHAVCIDPWLTSRRACCPLCKADYYMPKPRPATADQPLAGTNTTSVIGGSAAEGSANSRAGRMNFPSGPANIFQTLRAGRLPRPGPSRRGGPQIPDASPVRPLEMPLTATGSGGEQYNRPTLLDRIRVRFPLERQRSEPVEPSSGRHASEGGSRGIGSVLSRLRIPVVGAVRRQAQEIGPAAPGANSTDATPSNLEAGVRS